MQLFQYICGQFKPACYCLNSWQTDTLELLHVNVLGNLFCTFLRDKIFCKLFKSFVWHQTYWKQHCNGHGEATTWNTHLESFRSTRYEHEMASTTATANCQLTCCVSYCMVSFARELCWCRRHTQLHQWRANHSQKLVQARLQMNFLFNWLRDTQFSLEHSYLMIYLFLWEFKIHYRFQRSPTLNLTMSQLNPLHYVLILHFSIFFFILTASST